MICCGRFRRDGRHHYGRVKATPARALAQAPVYYLLRFVLQSAKHVAGSQDQKADQQEREPAVDIRDAEMSVVNNCGDQGNDDRDTESDDLGRERSSGMFPPLSPSCGLESSV